MMRILFVNQAAQISGAEHSLVTLLKGLDNTVTPVVACPAGELGDVVREMGIAHEPIVGTRASFRVHPVHTSSGLLELARSAYQVRGLVRRLAPDLVYANTTRAALISLLPPSSGPPVLAHIRDWAPEGRLSRLVFRLIARRADAIVVNSEYIGRQFDGMRHRGPVRVIYDPVDLSYFDAAVADGAAVRRELRIPPDAVVLAVIGQITPWKGQAEAIEMHAELAASGRDVFLLIAGSAKFDAAGGQFDTVGYARELHTIAEDGGFGDRVMFLGERSDVRDILAATDVALLPSWREAFGRIVIEAMAMGAPVAATEVGGPAETVRPGLDGVLLPPRAPDAWSRALEPLVDDRELRERMGRSAAQRAEDFGVEAHIAQILDLFRELAPR